MGEGKYSYEKELWDGMNIVNNRCEEAKNTLADMIKLFDVRASLESDYSKKLQQLCSKPSSTPEARSVGKGWVGYRQSNEQTQKIHAAISQTYFSLLTDLNAYRKDYLKNRDQLMGTVNTLTKDLEKGRSAVKVAKTNYYKKSEVDEAAAVSYSKAQQDPQITPKNLTKYNAACQKAKKETEIADAQYRDQVNEFQQFQLKYEDSMKNILTEFQKMEEKRLGLCKEVFEKIGAAEEQENKELKSDHEQLKSVIATIDGNNDLQAWISENKTGLSPDKPIEYEPFKSSLPPSSPSPGVNSSSSNISNSSSNNNNNSNSSSNNINSSSSNLPAANSGGMGGLGSIMGTLRGSSNNNVNPSPSPSPPSNPSPSPPAGRGVALPGAGAVRGRGGAAAGGTIRGSAPAPPSRNKPTPPPEDVKARALYDYAAQDETEVSFEVGDIIKVTKQDGSGWWEGVVEGKGSKGGMFPANYVSLLDASSPKLCKVLYEFTAESSDELTIKVGEVITILETAEGWFSGKNSQGDVGIFPANYVQLL